MRTSGGLPSWPKPLVFFQSTAPLPLQIVSQVVPARYFMRILRGIILKGAPATAFPGDLLALALFATIALTLASTRLSSRRA